MRSILTALTILTATTAQAQTEPQCAPAGALRELLNDQFSLAPLFEFNGAGGEMIFMVNQDDGRWLLLTRRGALWCYVTEGLDFRPYSALSDGGL